MSIGGAELGGEQVPYRGQRLEGTCGGQKAGGPRGDVTETWEPSAGFSTRGTVQTEGAVQGAGATSRRGKNDVRLPGTVCSGHTPGDHVGNVTEIWEPSAGIGTQQWEALSKSTQRAGRHAHIGEHAEVHTAGSMQRAQAPCKTHGRRAEHTGGVQNTRAACRTHGQRANGAERAGSEQRARDGAGGVAKTWELSKLSRHRGATSAAPPPTDSEFRHASDQRLRLHLVTAARFVTIAHRHSARRL
ncbi:hypothetical protein GGX14DRAFT_632626 [Mycena pura]|uniref:Uncharacterized protein n=1 Tax=Mycena pura TaxID=153505 RepID=A0AAD6VGZ6_9AGAR|nr:hypothetical protein GGX14DRAFT_632626 [Mycena pura]